jgi:hypothetical protein
VTLLAGCGEYVALFECATRISKALGSHGLEDMGDGLLGTIPRYRIPFGEMAAALAKLTELYSVALVDVDEESRFVLIVRLNVKVPEELSVEDI